MSELIKTPGHYTNIRGKLLATASCLALLACASHAAYADDETDRPTVWLELGGQLERASDTQDSFVPPFLLKPLPSFETVSPLRLERPPQYSIGGEAKFSFQPEDTSWVFAASIRYGRANGNKAAHQQTTFNFPTYSSYVPYDDSYASTNVTHRQSHDVVDFAVGKDFGLGMFGKSSSSTFSLGVRFAQFESKTTVNIRERPDLHAAGRFGLIKYFHSYGLVGQSMRSFHGIGPSLSWDASVPVAGNPETTEFTVDWGANAAVLFGRQKASVSHHTSGRYVKVYFHTPVPLPYENSAPPRNSARGVIIPNLGGFVGASVKFPNAKVSLGYRADFFFGAVDGGIDSRVTKTLGFNGPFASISVGFGG